MCVLQHRNGRLIPPLQTPKKQLISRHHDLVSHTTKHVNLDLKAERFQNISLRHISGVEIWTGNLEGQKRLEAGARSKDVFVDM